MALDKLTLLDETIINNTATSVATTVVNNSAQTNYISFPVATASPTSNGWRVYKDTDTVAPTVGTGGSPNTTLTQNTDTPLNSTGDFRLTKTSSASRRGEGISTDFTIASRHLAKVLQISFDYELISGTLATDDIRVYIIANPSVTINQGVTNIIIEPVNVSIQGSLVSSPTIKLRHLATFQTHISVTSYRLCVHVASTSTSAYTVDFNNFRVWEPTQSIGAVITDWQSYTPTYNTNVSSRSGYWQRIGGFVHVSISMTFTGSVGSLSVSNLLPPGIVPDLSKLQSFYSNRFLLGFGAYNDTGIVNDEMYMTVDASNTIEVIGFAFGSGDSVTFRLYFPIAGWGSSVAMSSDTGDGRVVACKYTGMTNVSVTASTIPFKWTTRAIDTHNSYDPSTGRFTAPINGIYRVSLTCSFDLTAGSIYIFKNGNIDTYIIQISSSTYVQGGSAIISLNAGDYIDVRQTNGTYTSYANSYVHISIDRISAGSQVVATQETVVATATKESGSWSENTIVTWSNKQIDTHGALNISTGEFTCPMNGKYLITANLTPNNYFTGSGNTTFTGVQIRKNATLIARSTNYWAGGSTVLLLGMACTHIIDCIAGDKLSIYGVGTWTVETGKHSHLSIMRIGI